jgi:hypothetical protein
MQIQIVRPSKRSREYIRNAAENIADPSALQAAQRLRLSQASIKTFGIKGVIERSDGTRIPRNASIIAPLLQGPPETLIGSFNTPTGSSNTLTTDTKLFSDLPPSAAPVPLDHPRETPLFMAQPATENQNYPDEFEINERLKARMKDSAFLHSLVADPVLEVPQEQPTAAPTITVSVSDAPVPTDDDIPSAGSSFMGSLLMIGADIFDGVMTQKIIPSIMAAPASPKVLSLSKPMSTRGKSMNNTQTQGPLRIKYGFMGEEVMKMSEQLRVLNMENANLKQVIASRAANSTPITPIPAPRKASTMTRESITKRFGFTG